MEVNERIVEEYLKTVKGWFYISDIPFEVPHNYSNIDILAYDPKKNIYYDIEVKYRSAFKMSRNDIEKEDGEFYRLLNQFLRPEREKKIEEIIGENHKPIKIFVTTRQYFGKTHNGIEKALKSKLKEHYYESDIWYFDDIISELYKQTEKAGRYNSELLQTIRLIKTYIPDKE